MRLWALLLMSVLYATYSYGQVTEEGSDRLNLVYTDYATINSVTSLTVYYGGIFEHKGNTLAADSSYTYENEARNQFFEAFGNVVITQPSGTVIYADKLHYDALVQHATLTGNVKMVDANSVLTTNYLTYNLRSKTGTYRTGGRIVSQGDTITSKNAYYFENTADAYFRHDVIIRTPNVKVYTDSMRYNSVSRETYFYGPTNIKGTKGENLYTERGNYNTGTGIARFSRNNLYTEGTRFLKGDSLYYNRDLGVGEAHRNVVFVDTLDKFYALGDKGLYRQEDESILMTEKPLIILVVKNDSTATEDASDSTRADLAIGTPPAQQTVARDDVEAVAGETTVDSLTLADMMHRDNREIPPKTANVDSVYLTADTLFSKMILLKDYVPLDLQLSRDGGQLLVDEDEDYGDGDEDGMDSDNPEAGLLDEVPDRGAPDARTRVVDRLTNTVDTGTAATLDRKPPPVTADTKPKSPAVTAPKKAEVEQTIAQTLRADSVLRQETAMPTGNEAEDMIAEAMRVVNTADTLQRDTVSLDPDINDAVADTARTRIVRAHYNVRLFKSDLQAVADSVYYGMADSMFRFMGRPMIWAEDSQISADTIFMQIVNQQVDNALLKDNAFMVNATLDTLKFNQLKGRKITAFFTNNNVDRIYVDGNAENISFSVNEKHRIITEMFHDRGSRIKVKMENREIIDYITVQGVDQKIYPFNMVTQENEILPGFIWRPQDRPRSKEDLLNRKREIDRGTSGEAAASESHSNGEEGESKVLDPDSLKETETTAPPKTGTSRTIEAVSEKELELKESLE